MEIVKKLKEIFGRGGAAQPPKVRDAFARLNGLWIHMDVLHGSWERTAKAGGGPLAAGMARAYGECADDLRQMLDELRVNGVFGPAHEVFAREKTIAGIDNRLRISTSKWVHDLPEFLERYNELPAEDRSKFVEALYDDLVVVARSGRDEVLSPTELEIRLEISQAALNWVKEALERAEQEK